MIKNLKLEMKRHKTVKPSYICYQPQKAATLAYQNSNRKNYKQSTHTITENLHTLKIDMSFRSCHFVLLLDVMSYFVVFDWKNLQNEQLYTLIPVPITCCILTTKIFHFSDLHIKLYREEVYYSWTAKKYLLLANLNSEVGQHTIS